MESIIGRAAIFGAAGAIGQVLVPELDRRGIFVRVVGRSRPRLQQAFGALANIEVREADIGDARSAGAAAQDIDTIFYCVGLPYPQHHMHPILMRSALEGAAAAKVKRVLLVSSVYAYGVPRTSRVAESHPRIPGTRKGTWRREQEDLVLDARKKGQLDGLVIRLPDFYGPFADIGLANPVLRAALAGKTANWVGPTGAPHEFIYTPDAASVIADLASRENCYGEAWNLGGAGEIPVIDFITRAYRAAGRQPKYRTIGRGMLKVLGWFSPLMRELQEMMYLEETPVILDDSKLLTKLGTVHKTSYDEGIRQTLDWMRAH